MVLKFKNPAETDLKKVMVYGMDGTGKSTFAANYCKKHNLNPVVIDIDDTNKTFLYSQGRVLDLRLKNDVQTFQNIKKAIEEIRTSEFDTIIIDGVTSMLEMLVSNAKGLAKYSDRASRFNKILQTLLDSGKNLIFVGQIDMEVIFTEDFQSSKAVIKVNSLVNEKYFCFIDDKGNFTYEVKKLRTLEEILDESRPAEISQPKVDKTPGPKFDKVPEPTFDKVPEPEPIVVPEQSQPQTEFMTAGEIGEPNPADDPNPLRSQALMIKEMLEEDGKEATKQNMKIKAVRVGRELGLPEDNKRALLEYIAKHCPEELS